MKHNGYHTEVKQALLQRRKKARHKQIRAVARAKDNRKPVDGLEATRVANKVIDNLNQEE